MFGKGRILRRVGCGAGHRIQSRRAAGNYCRAGFEAPVCALQLKHAHDTIAKAQREPFDRNQRVHRPPSRIRMSRNPPDEIDRHLARDSYAIGIKRRREARLLFYELGERYAERLFSSSVRIVALIQGIRATRKRLVLSINGARARVKPRSRHDCHCDTGDFRRSAVPGRD